MSFIEKLDKDILKKKEQIEEFNLLNQKLRKKIREFKEEIYNKNLIKDFIEIEKLCKKHSKNDEGINVKLDSEIYELQVTKKDIIFGDEIGECGIKIELIDSKIVPLYESSKKELNYLKSYKFLETNFYINVIDIGQLKSSRFPVSEKKFQIRNKEKSYEYFIDLFKKKILFLDKL